jgi:hypothetical protein
MHQLLVCAHNLKILGENISTIKKYTDLLGSSEVIGPEVKAEKTR